MRFHKIEEMAQQRTEQEMTDWQQSYHTRLAEARQIILREVHGNILEPPKPAGIENIPNLQALDVKADQRIRLDHEHRLAVIKQDELDQYQELQNTVRGRNRLRGQATEEFNHTNKQVPKQVRPGPSRS